MSSLLYYFTIFVVGIVRHLRTARTRLELQLCHRKRIRKLGQKDVDQGTKSPDPQVLCTL